MVREIELSIIIINYKTQTLIEKCTESILQYMSGSILFEIIIVDNNSQDESIPWLKRYSEQHPEIKVIFSDQNNGFAKGNNIGARAAMGRVLLFLNSDTYLIDTSVIEAYKWLCLQNDSFGCGCRLLNDDKTAGISYGKFPSIRIVALEMLTNKFNRFRGVVPQSEGIYPIDFPCGAFFMIKQELFQKFNGFDENFFMYYEETDLAKRAWKSGYKIWYHGKTRVVHIGGGSSFDTNHRRSYPMMVMANRSWKKFIAKHYNGFNVIMMFLLLTSYYFIWLTGSILLRKNKLTNFYYNELKAAYEGWRLN